MPRTGPTLCYPKIGYVDRSVAPLSTLVPFSPLVHTWRQRRLSPKYQIQNYTVTLNTIPHTSRNTRCHINIPLRHFLSNTKKPKLHESCSTKSKPYSMLQIKTFFVVLLKKSFVIHLCCLKNIVLEKLTISRNAIEAFEANGKLYQFCRIPFGVTNGVTCFQRIIDKIIKENNLTGVYAYVNKIVVVGKNQQEHDENLEKF